MDWSNERYVRLFTRDTVTWKLLSWQARAVLMFVLRKVDRAGVIDVGKDGARGLAALIEVPLDVVTDALEQLTAGPDPTLTWNGQAYALPRFLEAQEAAMTDAQRQRESRARRRDRSIAPAGRDVTEESRHPIDAERSAHDPGHDRHARDRSVTPTLPSPDRESGSGSQGLLVQADRETTHVVQQRAPRARRAKPTELTSAETASVDRVLGRLSKANGVAYRGSSHHARLIASHLRAGVTELELRAVVAYCETKWEGKPDMQQYLRPETLFGPQTIERYLAPARTHYADELRRAAPQQSLEVGT